MKKTKKIGGGVQWVGIGSKSFTSFYWLPNFEMLYVKEKKKFILVIGWLFFTVKFFVFKIVPAPVAKPLPTAKPVVKKGK